jgi:hypothetical protein
LTKPFTVTAWEHCFESLHAMRLLKDNWDDADAAAPRPDLIDSGEEVLRTLLCWQLLPAPSRVCAGPNGTLLIEWQNGANYFELEVCDPRSVEWMLAIPNEPPQHGKGLDRLALERMTHSILT